MGLGIGFLWALLFALGGGIAGAIRYSKEPAKIGYGFVGNFVVDLFILFFVNWLTFFFARPMMVFPYGLIAIVFLNLAVVAVVATCWDFGLKSVSLSSIGAWLLVIVTGIFWIAGVNSGHSAHKASHIVAVSVAGQQAPPASSTAQLVTVDSSVATTRASQAMTSGIAGQRNFSTFLMLGPAQLQMVAGQMVYVFPLEFEGAGAKQRLHAIEPGYMMVSATNPNAPIVENYDNQYSMIVSLGNGQGGDPLRWAYDHGYSGYLLDDPTLEIRDDGAPFYTVTLLRPQLGWTFDAPVGVLLINAHTGQITRYAVGQTPDWVDRVYSQQMASNLATWYGFYGDASFSGTTNANRFQVSGDPTLTYTGGEHPVWRVLLTSYNTDVSVSKILEINSATGAMSVYTPTGPMGTEGSATDAFNNASGVGASMIRANHYVVSSLALHVIYGHLTWMATYVPDGVSNPTFVGIGFVDAYHAQANNVAFGSTREAALAAYLTQLSQQGNSQGNAPGAGALYTTVTGKISAIQSDITGGQKYVYVMLAGQDNVAYEGTATNLGPAVLFAQVGQTVKIQIYKVDLGNSVQTMTSFTDPFVPIAVPGS
jgi:hypothetical protein